MIGDDRVEVYMPVRSEACGRIETSISSALKSIRWNQIYSKWHLEQQDNNTVIYHYTYSDRSHKNANIIENSDDGYYIKDYL